MFADRAEAGRRLAAEITGMHVDDPVVVALPRGGVPVAAEVAQALAAPLDVIIVRKVGVPYQRELAMGAVGEGGVLVLDDDLVRRARVGSRELERIVATERDEIERRAARYRGGRPRVDLGGRTVVIVDDGIATGSTARAACRVARARGARLVVLAVPVASPSSVLELRDVADEIVCLATPDPFYAVGQFYANFSQTSDDEVVELLTRARRATAIEPVAPVEPVERVAPVEPVERVATVEPVEIALDDRRHGLPVTLAGDLAVPRGARGLVVFAHGSGSSRRSPRNAMVARTLQQASFATLLLDLLTPHEADDRSNVFDIELLAARLSGASSWASRHHALVDLPIGWFGASTGAAAALWAAGAPEAGAVATGAVALDTGAGRAIETGAGGTMHVSAIVSRGGRPDLARPRLHLVTAPTLLIVGAADTTVLALNRDAARELRCAHELAIVPGATHLFEEPGTLDHVARLAAGWFQRHLPPPGDGERARS